MLEVLQQDYIRTARAKGVAQGGILFVHALKNAAVPIVTVIGIGVALLIGGAVVTESVFAIPGLGRLTVDAILRRDYPVIQGVVLLFSFVYVLVNLIDRSALHAARSEDPLLSAAIRDHSPCRQASPLRRQLPDLLPPVKVRRGLVGFLRRHPTIAIGGALLIVMVLIAVLAPYLGTVDPTALAPAQRTRAPSADLLVRHRHARPRHLFARALRRARVAHRRLLGGASWRRSSGSPSAWSPASCAGPTASSCASWTA